jgi:hypothetical protein
MEDLGTQPKLYIKLVLGSAVHIVRAQYKTVWNKVIVVEGDLGMPLYILLFDEDEFGTDVLLSAAVLPVSFTRSCTDKGKLINIRLHDIGEIQEDNIYEADAEVLEPGSYAEDPDNCPDPVLQLQVQCVDEEALSRLSAVFASHSTVRGRLTSHTLYQVLLRRRDGVIWPVDLRFSQLWKLRKRLLKHHPELGKIDFPRRTVFSSISSSESYSSKLNELRIQQRKESLEGFLNYLLGADVYRSHPAVLALVERPVIKQVSVLSDF